MEDVDYWESELRHLLDNWCELTPRRMMLALWGAMMELQRLRKRVEELENAETDDKD